MGRTLAAVLLIALLAIGGGLIATTAYQAGLNTAVTTTVANGATVVAPVAGYGWGYGWHPFGFGFGIFGFLGTLIFILLVFALLRAIFWGGRRGWGPGGWGPGHHGYDPRSGPNPWFDRFGPSFEEWHRRAHEGGSSDQSPSSNTGSTPV
jgi:hypothetical protein